MKCGTSSFNWWEPREGDDAQGEAEEEVGDCEWDSRLATFCRSSSSLRVMEFWVAVRDNWFKVSLARASSRWS